MAATIAHEINNPLESVINLIFLARQNRLQPERTLNYLLPAESEFSTTKGNLGTGIGLWVAKQLTERRGSQIVFHSVVEPGKSGTTVSICLPFASSPEAAKTVLQGWANIRLNRRCSNCRRVPRLRAAWFRTDFAIFVDNAEVTGRAIFEA
jgi:signal transduction histidine kinase